MKRLVLVVAAPVVVAAVLVSTSAYVAGTGEGTRQPSTSATAAGTGASLVAEATAAPGTLVLGGQAGELAVGLGARRAPRGRLELEASVLKPDGTGTRGLHLAFAAAGASVVGRACGTGRYCGVLAATVPIRIEVRITEDGRTVTHEFALPKSWRPARKLVEKATATYEALDAVTYHESLSPGSGKPVETSWQIAAPNRLAYQIADGPAAVVIGKRRWDREPGGPWSQSRQSPLMLPEPPWTQAVDGASVLGSATVAGRQTWVVSFLDRAALPTWFTIWIDKHTYRTLKVSMTTSAHFMRQRYLSFDEPVEIEPPR